MRGYPFKQPCPGRHITHLSQKLLPPSLLRLVLLAQRGKTLLLHQRLRSVTPMRDSRIELSSHRAGFFRVFHSNATTISRIRREIQQSNESVAELAKRYGGDRSHRPYLEKKRLCGGSLTYSASTIDDADACSGTRCCRATQVTAAITG